METIVLRLQRGKSGQHRATHRLSAGCAAQAVQQKVPQKITTLLQGSEKVKMCGKSAQRTVATLFGGKPCVL
jgi:hypothetical protein